MNSVVSIHSGRSTGAVSLKNFGESEKKLPVS